MRASRLTILQGWTRCDRIMASQTPGSPVKLIVNCARESKIATPLLTTKLYIPPARSELVSRPRLIERLKVRLNRNLPLVSAPGGVDFENGGKNYV